MTEIQFVEGKRARMLGDAIAPAPRQRVVPVIRSWERWALAVATIIATLTRTGAFWDVQWHWAVGRDSFFIPPHDLIYTGVVVAGSLGLLMVWRYRRRRDSVESPWPWGWFLQLLGAAMMVSAAPFDELWHRRFGIDVTIWSPPHMVGVFGGWTIHLGLLVAWATAWQRAPDASFRRGALFGLTWATTLLVSMMNFGLIPAVRWSVMQPVVPTLYTALGSLLIPIPLLALAWVARRPALVLLVFAGLVGLRLFDQLLWAFGLEYVVPLFGQTPRKTDLSVLHRHFWFHPLLNLGPVLAVALGLGLARGRSDLRRVVVTGLLAGLSVSIAVPVLAAGWLVPVVPFADRGATGRDFHAETDLLLSLLGRGQSAALIWALIFGSLGGLAGWGLLRFLQRAAEEPRVATAVRRARPAV